MGPLKHVAQGEIHEKGRAPSGAADQTRLYAYLVSRANVFLDLLVDYVLWYAVLCIWLIFFRSIPMCSFSRTLLVALQFLNLRQQCQPLRRSTEDNTSAPRTQSRVHAAPSKTDTPETPKASKKGVLSPLRDGGAAAVVCSAGADLDALAEALPEPKVVERTPVDSGVSP